MGYDPLDKERRDARTTNLSRSFHLLSVKSKRHLSHERRVFLMALVGGLPGALVALILIWNGDYTTKVEWTLTVLILGCWLGFASALRTRVVLPLQTLSNILAAL